MKFKIIAPMLAIITISYAIVKTTVYISNKGKANIILEVMDEVLPLQAEIATNLAKMVPVNNLRAPTKYPKHKYVTGINADKGQINIYLKSSKFGKNAYIQITPVFGYKDISWACVAPKKLLKYMPEHCMQDFVF